MRCCASQIGELSAQHLHKFRHKSSLIDHSCSGCDGKQTSNALAALALLVVHGDFDERKGRYGVRRLIEKYVRNANMMKWKEQLNATVPSGTRRNCMIAAT